MKSKPEIETIFFGKRALSVIRKSRKLAKKIFKFRIASSSVLSFMQKRGYIAFDFI